MKPKPNSCVPDHVSRTLIDLEARRAHLDDAIKLLKQTFNLNGQEPSVRLLKPVTERKPSNRSLRHQAHPLIPMIAKIAQPFTAKTLFCEASESGIKMNLHAVAVILRHWTKRGILAVAKNGTNRVGDYTRYRHGPNFETRLAADTAARIDGNKSSGADLSEKEKIYRAFRETIKTPEPVA